MTNGLETAHSPVPFSSAFMGTFGPVVRVLIRVMERIGDHVALGRTVASQFIGHESSRRLALSLEEFSKEAGRSFCIATRLEQDIQNLTVLIHGSIEISQMATNAKKDLIDEPLITAGCGPFSKPVGIGWTKSNTPTPDCLVRYSDPALGEQIFDIAIAQAESVVQPYSVAKDFLWKAAAMIHRFSGFHPASVANRQLA